MDEVNLRQEMIATCRRMNEPGINQGTSGNLSARQDDHILITPTSLPYDEMQPDDIVRMEFDGRYAGRRPSSEWRFHRDILAARRDVNAVLHCHSTFATTLACHHRGIPAFHYMIVVAGGADIHCAPYATFGTQALSDVAVAALANRKACPLGQHGQIALGGTMKSALYLAVEVETLARMYVQALSLAEPPILSDEEIDRVMKQMRDIHYGPVAAE